MSFETWADEAYPGWRTLHPEIAGSRREAYLAGRKEALAEAAQIARTPFTGEQDDITMQAKDRIAQAIERAAEGK